jgi:Protein of unknown function (DUF1501)
MERRDFLKMASMAGLGVVAASSLGRDAAAADDPYQGPLWLCVHAGGGWDPTSHCDPKGSLGDSDPKPMNHYVAAAIEEAGNIKYAPVPPGVDVPAGAMTNTEFFQKHHGRLLVVNGIDTETNSHDAGTRTTWSGTLREGKPSFSALLAGVYGATLPMGFLSNGGYDTTANVVAVTRVPGTDLLAKLAYPNVINPDRPQEEWGLYQTEATVQRIIDARNARHEAKLAQQRLPRIREAMSTLYTSRLGQNELKQLIQYLPPPNELNQLRGIRRQAQVAMAAYRAGICISANLSLGGFDTHNDHDRNQYPRIWEIWSGVDWILSAAEEQGLADRIRIIIGSDFGRTPGYNDGNGKDHWNITSMIMTGPGIPGDRVIGATDERHGPLKIDPATLQVSESGIRIKPGHIHKALRKLASIDTAETVQRFPMSEVEELPLFG